MLSHEELQQCVETMQEIFYKKMCVFSFSLFPYRNSAHRYHPGNPQQCCIFHFPVDTPSPRQGIHSLRNLKDLLRRKVVIPFTVMLQLCFRFVFITFKFLWNEAKYFQWRIYIVKFWTRPPPPPGGPNSFNFMQFSGKIGKIICWRPPGELAPPPRGNPGSATDFFPLLNMTIVASQEISLSQSGLRIP